MRRLAAVAALVVLASSAVTSAVALEPPQRYVDHVFTDVSVTKDVVYGQAVNDTGQLQQLTMDIYEPAGDELAARPAFVWAHGGSLVFGDKGGSMEQQFGNEFAKRGWVFVSINYRLMSQFIPGDCLHDIICALNPRLPIALREATYDMKAAVRFLRANAELYRINTNEITAGGHSAGTALALMTNFSPEDPGDSGNPGYDSSIQAAMTNSGTMLEAELIGPGEPPIIMFNTLDDGDLTLPIGFPLTCVVTTVMGNVCEFHGYDTGGHSLSVHRPEIFQETAEFFCRRVIADCADLPAPPNDVALTLREDGLPDYLTVAGPAALPLISGYWLIPAHPLGDVMAILNVILNGLGSLGLPV